ncbi:hypothetical protein ASF04_06555 [Duganella sp. Leaf61]|uniref:hypothetical protein n=1 Tax=Duganella sp. Leaf61 TaxID=1736227 RepID=UPI0006FB544D|nr:hypothetical protein [Duganella sp. Leaf61]KQN75714.1 hypothetical protein ASF04_06555 [Duganella sp. Leaf61]
MLKSYRALYALPVVAALLLSACAVNRQGNNFKFGIDVDELTASTLQEFQLGTARGVLRRTQQNQVQIKLYDRMKLIDLGQLSTVRIGDAVRFPAHDLILVHVPTAHCPYAYRLYQLSGYEVGMWNINDIAGRCSMPLSFSADAQSWVAQQQSVPNPVAWAWSNGQLVSGPLPRAPGADNATANLPRNGAGTIEGSFQRGDAASGAVAPGTVMSGTAAPRPARSGTISGAGTQGVATSGGATPGSAKAGATGPAANTRPAAGMRFETADGAASRASTGSTAPRDSATSAAGSASAAAAAPAAGTASAPARAASTPAPRASAPAGTLKRVDSGSYARLPDASSATVVPPTRIILRNSNGEGAAQ